MGAKVTGSCRNPSNSTRLLSKSSNSIHFGPFWCHFDDPCTKKSEVDLFCELEISKLRADTNISGMLNERYVPELA